MTKPARVLLCWEPYERNSWNPDLAAALRAAGMEVVEAHDLGEVLALELSSFDVCLPRFRMSAANMQALDEVIEGSGVPVVNPRDARLRSENKALAHASFERAGIPQPGWVTMSAEGHLDRSPWWEGETLVKPIGGCRGEGIETLGSATEALGRARERQEAVIVQELLWPARSWRVIASRCCGAVDPYWRRPKNPDERVLSISTGSEIMRERSAQVEEVALEMLEAVGGDLLAADVLETSVGAFALEINHNFDAHGGTVPAVEAFVAEIERAQQNSETSMKISR